jgi:hypothetical protein
MSRKMRENMMNYIERMRGISLNKMVYMTDQEIEHIYEITYLQEEFASEGE